MSDEYKPISCALYSQFELWIMHGDQIRLAWHAEDNVTRMERVVPRDVRAEKGVEYLYFHDMNTNSSRVRLDRILEASPI